MLESIIQRLKANDPTLQTLDLWGNNIGAAGAKDIADALKNNTTLQTLDLNSNNIGAAVAKELADALKTNTTLQSLDLRHNNIGAEGANIGQPSFFRRCLKVISDNAKYIGYAMLALVGCCALVYCTKKFQLNFKDGVLNSMLNSLSTTEVSR